VDPIFRAAAIYFFLLIVFRLSGRRTLSQITTFDFVLLLIIGEATQQALLREDFSVTNAWIIILALIAFDFILAQVKRISPVIDHVLEGSPVILVDHGQPIQSHLKGARVEEEDILETARQSQGLERMDQIKYAVLERSGQISIIPR
jgi:uncharacterized membrane protein YcaP (DUF421 family)